MVKHLSSVTRCGGTRRWLTVILGYKASQASLDCARSCHEASHTGARLFLVLSVLFQSGVMLLPARLRW